MARRSLLLALALGGVALSGCVSPRLVDERCQAPYAGYLEAYERLPQTTRRFEVEVDGGRRLAIALHHVPGARGSGRPTLVLQPGILASGETWRFLAGALDGDHELLIVDPPGTGASDAPAAHTMGPRAYSPTWLADATLGAVAAFERAHGERTAFVLVGHSLGGAVVLRALGDPGLRARHGALLARVHGALLFNPADILLDRQPKALRDIAQVSDLEVGLAERLGVLQETVRSGVRDNVRRPQRDALRSEALRIEALMGRPASRHAMQATLRSFQPLLPGTLTVDRAAVLRLAANERTIDVPVRILWGTADRTLTEEQGRRLGERLPTCRLVPLVEIGHSSHQERLDEHLDQVRALLAEIAANPNRDATPGAP